MDSSIKEHDINSPNKCPISAVRKQLSTQQDYNRFSHDGVQTVDRCHSTITHKLNVGKSRLLVGIEVEQ